jgi:long-chain acyl-CoA synthetase
MLIHPKNHARVTPDKLAYVVAENGETMTYRQLDEQSNRHAQLFRALGLAVGDGVALWMENRTGFFEICWAAQRAGLYYTPISTHLKADEIAYILNDCGARIFIASARYRSEAERLGERLPKTTIRLSFGGEITGFERLEDLLSEQPPTPIDDETTGSSMLYSSGTTGYPKGVRRALSGDAIDDFPDRYASFRDRYEFDPATIYLSPAPLYHAAPLGFTMATLAFGGTCIVMQRFDAEQALALIERYQVTHSQWVPTMFIRLLRLDDATRKRYDLSTHRIAIHAAAPCPVATKHEMIAWWGPIVHEYYAGSEGVGSTHITSAQWLAHPGSVGRSVDGVLHIVDEAGAELGPGEVGTVFFADAPHFEYHNAPAKTAEAFSRDGWGTLGDVGYLDEEAYLYLTDRKANMIISGGVNIYPQEAENILLGHADVLDAAVFGVPNEDFGEEVKAVVQLVPGRAPDADLQAQLIEYCRQRIADIKCPRSVDFESELPRLPNGKLYKRQLKARYWPSE